MPDTALLGTVQDAETAQFAHEMRPVVVSSGHAG
jgi:hypothetical protein